MIKSNQWIKQTIISIFALLAGIGVMNYFVDPFVQYRVAKLTWFDGNNERYINAGLAKNYQYESIIVGSSMVENFLISKVEEVFPKAIKLPYRGGTAYEVKLVLETAIENNLNIKNIILGLDFYALNGDYQRTRYGKLPLYLYDRDYFNDYKYLLNYNTLLKSLNLIKNRQLNKNNIHFKYENMYQWQHEFKYKFSKNNVLKIFKERKKNIGRKFSLDTWAYWRLKESFEKNLLKIIIDNPKIKFYIFYPPKSILTYKWWEEKEILKNIMDIKGYIYTSLSSYDNVKLYDFQLDYNIITNLDNYIDLGHYHQKINSWMIDNMKNDKFLVTNDNYINNKSEFILNLSKYIVPEIERNLKK